MQYGHELEYDLLVFPSFSCSFKQCKNYRLLFLVPHETSWSNSLQVRVTLHGGSDGRVAEHACKMYVLQKVCTTGQLFYLSSIQNIKQEKTKGIFSQMPQRLIGDESTSAGDCQYSLIFPLLPYNAWLLVYLVKGELLISTPL